MKVQKEKEEIEKLNVGLKLLEIESIRLDKIRQLLSEVIERTHKKAIYDEKVDLINLIQRLN